MIKSSANFVYRFKGIEYAPVAKSRIWLFPGNSRIIELEVVYQDCDGDFYSWCVKDKVNGLNRQGSVSEGNTYEETEAIMFHQIDEAINAFLEDHSNTTDM